MAKQFNLSQHHYFNQTGGEFLKNSSCQNYENRRLELISDISKAKDEEEEKLKKIPGFSLKKGHTTLIVVIAIFTNILLFSYDNENYLNYWVICAFIFLMVNPFLMMIPTERKSFRIPKKNRDLNRKEALAEVKAGLKALKFEKKILSEMAWNLFFINCHPLVPGFMLLFTGNIIFATFGYFTGAFEFTSSIIIIIQSLAILLFYIGIMIVKPYSTGFFSGLLGVSIKVKKHYKSGWISVLKYVLLISIFAVIAGILIVFALVLPGMSLGRVMTIEDVDFKVIMFLLIFASQVIFVRYLQGSYSKKLVNGFMSYKTEILRDGFLKALENIPKSPEGLSEEEVAENCGIMDKIEHASIKIRFLKTDHHHFFGYFPVCMIVPDIGLILELIDKYKVYKTADNNS